MTSEDQVERFKVVEAFESETYKAAQQMVSNVSGSKLLFFVHRLDDLALGSPHTIANQQRAGQLQVPIAASQRKHGAILLDLCDVAFIAFN